MKRIKKEKTKRKRTTTLRIFPIIPPENEEILQNITERNENIFQIRRDLDNDLSEIIYNELEPKIEMRSRIVISFSSLIHRGNGELINYHHTFGGEGSFSMLSEIKDYIERCEGQRLSLEGIAWSRAYLPPSKIIDKKGAHEGRVEFTEVKVKVIHSSEPLIGCGKLPEHLSNKKCLYAVDGKDDNMCFWRCMAIKLNIIGGKERPEKDIEKIALKLARDFYNNQKLKASEVRPTKLVDFEKIAKMFSINIRVYEQKEILKDEIWKLIFGKGQFKDNLPCLDIGLHEGHCFFIKDIEMLSKKWECSGCKQIFNRHDYLGEHVKNNSCKGGKTEVILTGKKINHIPGSSEKVFYGGNTQFSYKACRWIDEQSKIIGNTFITLYVVMAVKGVLKM